MFLLAGSKLESVIAEGTDALNAYISSGEIEELKDVIPPPEPVADEDDNDEPENKRQRVAKIVNHNAQIIYNRPDGSINSKMTNQQAIPSLMTLNVQLDVPVMPNISEDEDFRINPNAAWNPTNDANWGAPPPPMFNAATPGNIQPPSLLNLNVAPPDDHHGSAGSYGRSSSSKSDGSKRRNRDSEGKRISRFDREGPRPSRFDKNDSNDSGSSRSRRSGGSSNRNSERSSGARSSNRRI